MSSISLDSIKLFITPIEHGTSWQEISDAVKRSGISPNIGYVSMRHGTKNGFAVVTINRPYNGSFEQNHLNMLYSGKFIKVWNQRGTRYWKAYLYKPSVQGLEQNKVSEQVLTPALTSAVDAAVDLLNSLTISECERPPSPSEPPPDYDDETISTVSTGYDVDEPDDSDAGLFIDYVNSKELAFVSKPPAPRLRIRLEKK